MDFTELLILILATYRITNLFVDDKEGGPFEIMYKIRERAGVSYDEESQPIATTTLSSAMLCFWCWSFWMGLLVLVVSLIPAWIGYYMLLPFALSGGALAIKKGIID